MRQADKIPGCFQVESGPFDRVAVEAFFEARRAVLLEADPTPLVPLQTMPAVVQARWRAYLAEKASKLRPLNGTEQASGRLADRMAFVPPVKLVTLEEPKLKEAPKADATKPWEALGIPKSTYFHRKKAGKIA